MDRAVKEEEEELKVEEIQSENELNHTIELANDLKAKAMIKFD